MLRFILSGVFELRAYFISVLIFLIKAYQTCVSPFLPSSCIYWPTCSCYSKEALKKHGIFKGLY
ncbi:MAG: membrane protein insertion efficiency factor YidD, partial [Deltaproteobacteria bacterium]|nr:membrane protein insertion efficiency factor YidD [Deltaproteobacteria bacterium]